MAEVLNVEVRKIAGSRNAKRLRRAGSIPAVLYGHGQDTVCLAVSRDQFSTAMRHGSRLVDLKGGVNEVAAHPRLAMGHLRHRRAAYRLYPRLGRRAD